MAVRVSLQLYLCIVFIYINTHRRRIVAAPLSKQEHSCLLRELDQQGWDEACSLLMLLFRAPEQGLVLARFSECSAETPLEQPVLQREL